MREKEGGKGEGRRERWCRGGGRGGEEVCLELGREEVSEE